MASIGLTHNFELIILRSTCMSGRLVRHNLQYIGRNYKRRKTRWNSGEDEVKDNGRTVR